jgi:sensor histidine kinase YesM/Tfp pilus assembly protein PilF
MPTQKKLATALIAAALFLGLTSSAQQTAVDSLKRKLLAAKTDTACANLYNDLAFRFREIHPDSTARYARKALVLSQKIDYGYGAATAFVNLGNSKIVLGDYDGALGFFSRAQQAFAKLADDEPENMSFKKGLARSHASAGVVYSEKSNFHMALDHYEKALELYREAKDDASVSKALNNIGVVYKSQQNYSRALEYFKKALTLQRQNGEAAAAMTLLNIGVIYFETNHFTQALSFYEQARSMFANVDNRRGEALLHAYLGDFYLKQGNLGEAKKDYEKALLLNEAMRHRFGASLVLYKLAQMQFAQKRYADAFPLAQRSLDYAKSIGVLDQAYHSEKLLSDLYLATGNPAKSLEHYKNYISARDSITNQENAKKFAIAEMNHDYQKKEALLSEKMKRQNQLLLFSIAGTILLICLLLVAYNRRQVKRRLTLQKEVAEYEQKALHLQMNPHFVFNCLSSISSFIVQNGTDQALKYLSKFSKLMRLTLEYPKGPLIPIDKEIESLQNYLELEQLRFHDKFDFAIGQSENVEFNVGLPPLLIQPFVENAILHGMVPKEGRGNIRIAFDQCEGQLVCTITDDGIGIAGSQKLKENSVAAHQSMALDITKKRLQIMESTTSKSAQIEITDIHHGSQTGTRVTLRLPVQYIK